MLRAERPYTGCNAGITHFHADPHGKASICTVTTNGTWTWPSVSCSTG